VSARLPRTFEPAIKTVIAYCITTVDYKAATLAFVVTANRIEANPTAWSMFTLAWQVGE